MPINTKNFEQINQFCLQKNATLVAVSKTKPIHDLLDLYNLGQRHFGENYVQELLAKYEALPKDIYWHFIGHLQTNKVKMIAPFVHLIHGVDNGKLLAEIEKQGQKINRKIACLLQIFIATEATKFGLNQQEAAALLENKYQWAQIKGLMGMATNTGNFHQVQQEFYGLAEFFKAGSTHGFEVLSMGMSADYEHAISAGSNMIRVGSLLFGDRQ